MGHSDHDSGKTNAMRILDTLGLPFETLSYEVDEEDLSAAHAAKLLGIEPERVFKTIVLSGERTGHFVCIIPGPFEIDLKKAARAAGDKSCSLLPLSSLEPLTGYVRGGCSPLGMKKALPTFIDETCGIFDRISVSAGRRGLQILIEPASLVRASGAIMADLIL